MSALLDEPRIAYASRKVRRFRDDVIALAAEHAPPAGPGAREDLIRDANRLAQDLFTLDRLAIKSNTSATNREDPSDQVAADIGEWVAAADQLFKAAVQKGAGEVAGLAELCGHLMVAKELVANDPTERVFRELVWVWKNDTQYLSSVTAMTNHWAYQRIIRLGPPVVPLILRELRQKPDFWFAALREITGANPVPPDARGKVQVMADAWVKWGEANQLI